MTGSGEWQWQKILFSNGSRLLLCHFVYLQLLFHFVHQAVWRYSSSDKYGKKVVRLTHFKYCAQAILITKFDRTESVVGKCQFINMRISNIDKMSTVQCHWYGSGVHFEMQFIVCYLSIHLIAFHLWCQTFSMAFPLITNNVNGAKATAQILIHLIP